MPSTGCHDRRAAQCIRADRRAMTTIVVAVRRPVRTRWATVAVEVDVARRARAITATAVVRRPCAEYPSNDRRRVSELRAVGGPSRGPTGHPVAWPYLMQVSIAVGVHDADSDASYKSYRGEGDLAAVRGPSRAMRYRSWPGGELGRDRSVGVRSCPDTALAYDERDLPVLARERGMRRRGKKHGQQDRGCRDT